MKFKKGDIVKPTKYHLSEFPGHRGKMGIVMREAIENLIRVMIEGKKQSSSWHVKFWSKA